MSNKVIYTGETGFDLVKGNTYQVEKRYPTGNIMVKDGVGDGNIISRDEYTWVEETSVGEWIGWNGGECPVHPKTIVEVVRWHTRVKERGDAINWDDVIAYRVIEEHKEPKEYWIELTPDNRICATHTKPENKDRKDTTLVHVREVTIDE